MKRIFLFCIIFTFCHPVISQVVKFERTFNYHFSSFAQTIAQLSDEGYLVGGRITDTTTVSQTNMFLMRTDKFGDTLWTKHYDFGSFHNSWHYLRKIYAQPNGDIILFGDVYNNQPGTTESWIQMMRTDSSGNIIWSKKYSKLIYNSLWDAYYTSDNSFLIAGTSQSVNTVIPENILIKLDTSGSIVWSRKIMKDSVYIAAISEIAGSYYLLFNQVYNTSMNEIGFIKVSPGGSLISSNKWVFSGYASSASVTKTTDNHLAVVCQYVDSLENIMFFKSDTLGNIQWNKTYSHDHSYGGLIMETSDGGFALLTQRSFCNAPYNISFIKTDNQGDTLWTQTYGVTWNENHPSAIIQTADNGYAFTGNYGWYLPLIKTDEYGFTGCNYHCPINYINTTSIITSSDNYQLINDTIFSSAVSGLTYSGIQDSTHCSTVGIFEPAYVDNTFQIFPNPTTTILNIIMSNPEDITITDLAGCRLYNETKSLTNPGLKVLDISFLPAGIYFIKAGIAIKKFIKF